MINLGILGVLKYYNFFVSSFVNTLLQFGIKADLGTIKVILPVGISFYTFHGLSYVLDIYNGKIKCERNFVNYSLFVSFFSFACCRTNREGYTSFASNCQKKRI